MLDYLNVLKRYWLFIVTVTVLGLLAGLAFSATEQPKYSATARVFISAGRSSDVTDLSTASTFTQQVVKSYASVAQSRLLLRRVIARLGLHEPVDALAGTVSTDVPLDTSVLQIFARDSSPVRAAAIANAVSDELGPTVAELSPALNAKAIKVTQIDDAVANGQPVSPDRRVNALAGLLIGALLSFVIALVRQRLDTGLRTEREVEEATGMPSLGAIPFDRAVRRAPIGSAGRASAAGSVRAEGYRALRTNLQFLDAGGRVASFVVTSTLAGEGKTTTAANLAMAIAATGESVLVVDADLRRPTLSDHFGMDGSVGLTDVLIGRVALDAALKDLGPDRGLTLLPHGALPPNPTELLQSPRMTEVLDELRERFDVIVIDAPPVLPVADALILGKKTDGVLLVCGVGRAPRADVQKAVAALQRVGARSLGTVVSMLPRRQLRTGVDNGYPPADGQPTSRDVVSAAS